MPADLLRPTKRFHASDLLTRWKEIADTLVTRGHAAALYEELDHRSGRAHPVARHASQSAYGQHEKPHHGHDPPDKSTPSTNGAAMNRSTSDFANTDEGVSPGESESENGIFDEILVPSHLVDEAADLSQYYHTNSPPSFEEIFALESSFSPCHSRYTDPEGVPSHHGDGAVMSSHIPPSPLTLPPSELGSNRLLPSCTDEALEQGLILEAERVRPVHLMPLPRTSPPRYRKHSRKVRGLRVSDKKNLTPAHIPMVSDLLINPDAIFYFVCHCRSIYEEFIPFSAQPSQGSDNNVETSVIAALDKVQDLRKGNRLCRLRLRLAYVRLAWSIDAYKAVAATDRIEGKVSRNVGQRDATVAIDLYLETKRKASGEQLKRSQVVAGCRTGRRWALLAG